MQLSVEVCGQGGDSTERIGLWVGVDQIGWTNRLRKIDDRNRASDRTHEINDRAVGNVDAGSRKSEHVLSARGIRNALKTTVAWTRHRVHDGDVTHGYARMVGDPLRKLSQVIAARYRIRILCGHHLCDQAIVAL